MESIVFLAIVFLFGFGIWILPFIIGVKKRAYPAIFVLNLLTGWTFIGWIIALVWACVPDPPSYAPPAYYPPPSVPMGYEMPPMFENKEAADDSTTASKPHRNPLSII